MVPFSRSHLINALSAVSGRSGLQARVPGLDETGFSPGGNARSIYEMDSGINCLLVALPGLAMLKLLLITGRAKAGQ